jgi:hypothetical protein
MSSGREVLVVREKRLRRRRRRGLFNFLITFSHRSDPVRV